MGHRTKKPGSPARPKAAGRFSAPSKKPVGQLSVCPSGGPEERACVRSAAWLPAALPCSCYRLRCQFSCSVGRSVGRSVLTLFKDMRARSAAASAAPAAALSDAPAVRRRRRVNVGRRLDGRTEESNGETLLDGAVSGVQEQLRVEILPYRSDTGRNLYFQT